MANPEHVALVRKGAEAIAKWRQVHPDEHLDLRGADLFLAHLFRANLKEANLLTADLSGADLSEADLRAASLFSADLRGAKLSKADLSRADLKGADLSGAHLSGAHLSRADLKGADLKRADLSGADLSGANLSGANLSGAHLSGSHLSGAILSDAILSGANLSGANLVGADLRDANLSRTEFSQASLGFTSVGGLDLRQARGLETVRHVARSSVGVDTLITSFRGVGNKLTAELATFFLGAGVPPELLDALPDIVREVKHYSCFISYGQPDLEFAKKLYEDLKARGVSCWLYEMDKTVGKRTRSEIGESRRGADRFVVLCSAAALVRDGVLEEIEDQISDDPDRLVPISLDNLWKEPGFRIMRGTHDLKPDLVNRNYADFANRPYEGALEELLKGLRRPAVKKARMKKA